MGFKKVRVKWRGKVLEGYLIPYEGKESKELIFIKLSNGYNIGLKKDEVEIEEVGEEGVERVEEVGEEEGEIAVIGCGGTISSRVDYKTGAVYPQISGSFLKKAYREVERIANIKTRLLFNIFSEDMHPSHWEEISKAVYEELKEGKGVVVLHGTDTMHYTSAALSFAIETDKPIVMTGSQRSSDRPSSDAKLNFLNAVYSAKQDFGEVVVVMHKSIEDTSAFLHRGTRVRKMHTSRRDAFKSIGINPLAEVDYSKGLFKRIEDVYPLRKGKRLALHSGFNENIGLLYIHPGVKPELVEKYDMFDGVVIVGTGLGHAPLSNGGKAKGILKELKELREKGVILVMTSQTIYGRINLNVYRTGRELLELGIIGNHTDMLPEAAYVKLSWVMARERDYKRIKELMEKNIAGEITERSEYEGY